MKRVLLLAGEESGVMYARQIADCLRSRFPEVEIRGYGDYGFETDQLAVFGIVAVLLRIFFFLRVKRTMDRAIDEWNPDVVCTVDYPGMNLKLAAYAKSRGIRAVHVVCPQVWAWHQGRIPKIEASLDRLCCFFPFEPDLFREGFAKFVGHPLREGKRKKEREKEEGRSVDDRIVALLPGSRMGEIRRIMPTLLAAADELAMSFPDVRFVVPAASPQARRLIDSIVGGFKSVTPSFRLETVDGGARQLLGDATCAVVASGTATLEAALMRCPTLLVYRVSAITAAIARRVITGIRHVGLANIVAEKSGVECPMPELLQEDFTVRAVVDQLARWLSDGRSRNEAVAKLDRTMALLEGGEGVIDSIVDELT